MKNLLTKITKRLAKRYLPEETKFQEIWDSPAYLRAIQYVKDAERTKSLGIHKKEYAEAHLEAWFQERSFKKPKDHIINLLIELAIWKQNKWTL